MWLLVPEKLQVRGKWLQAVWVKLHWIFVKGQGRIKLHFGPNLDNSPPTEYVGFNISHHHYMPNTNPYPDLNLNLIWT